MKKTLEKWNLKWKTYSHTGIGLGYIDDRRIKLFFLIISVADDGAGERQAEQHDPRRPHRDLDSPRAEKCVFTFGFDSRKILRFDNSRHTTTHTHIDSRLALRSLRKNLQLISSRYVSLKNVNKQRKNVTVFINLRQINSENQTMKLISNFNLIKRKNELFFLANFSFTF